MSELYDYILTTYKVIVGLVTTKRLILAALIAIGFYFIWVCLNLLTSFQRKFSRRCNKLYLFLKKNQMNSTNLKVVDMRIEKISSGFYHGWKKFKTSNGKKPSDFITRREALDVEVSGGVLNQGKTVMRAFIAITTVVLFIFNFAYLGNNSQITAYLIAEATILPVIYYTIMKVFYFIYTSIKQQMYKVDIESFYDLVSVLDDTFGVTETYHMSETQNIEDIDSAIVETPEDLLVEGEAKLGAEEEGEEKEPELDEDNPLRKLDKYDVFKRKNIDVDKILNEVPLTTKTSLPYINVDSDYVIKDDENVETSKIVGEGDNGSSILGGMMQDMSSIKKANGNFLDVEKQIATIDEEKLNDIAESEKAEEENTDAEEPEAENAHNALEDLDTFSVVENSQLGETPNVNEQETSEESTVQNTEPEVESEPEIVEEPEPEPEPEIIEEPEPELEPEEDVSEIQKENIATVVSGFKNAKSKLASGGVIIERNTPITKRERPRVEESYSYAEETNNENYYPRNTGVNKLNINENTDGILHSLKTSAGGYEGYQGYAVGGFSQPQYDTSYNYNPQPFTQSVDPYAGAYVNQPQQTYAAYPNAGYGNMAYGANQNPYNQNYDAYNAQANYEPQYEEVEEPVYEETPAPVKKTVKRTKENEPRPRNLKSKVAENTKAEAPAKTRGRPKKQEVSESMTIKSEEEFNEVLARAEKLMRKSEEGLSQSQSKRVEKELKLLMDAMNRYKEGK